MRKGSLSYIYRVYLASAICAAHINSTESFRQKDVRFYLELFMNWMEGPLGFVEVQNTQIQRFLNNLVTEGILISTKGKIPSYQMKNRGFLSLIEMITSIEKGDSMELFLFQFHIVDIYDELLFRSASRNLLGLPKSVNIELRYLLSKSALIEKQKLRIQEELDKLNSRIEDSLKMEKLAVQLFKEKKSVDFVVKQIESAYPYQLHHQRKMSDLYKTITPELQMIELTKNTGKRATKLWQPLVSYYRSFLKMLDDLE
jgi:hypothetical protein